MKRLTLFALAAIAGGLFSCANQKGFTLTGELAGFSDSIQIRLQSLFTDEILDSAYLAGGRFTIKGTLDSAPEEAWLTIRDGAALYVSSSFMLSNDKLSLKTDKEGFGRHARVIGGKYQQEYNQMKDLNAQYYVAIDSLLEEFEAFGAIATREERNAQVPVINAKLGELYDLAERADNEFVRNNINTYAALTRIAGGFVKHQNRDTVRMLYAQLEPEYKTSKYGQIMEAYINTPTIWEGDDYYDFEALDQHGNTRKLSDFEQDYLLLAFCSAGCGACYYAYSEMEEIYKTMGDSVAVINYSLDTSKDTWEQSVVHAKIEWPYLWEGNGRNGTVPITYDIGATPVFVLIGPERKIVSRWGGVDPNDSEFLRKRITQDMKYQK